MSAGLFLVRRLRIWMTRLDFFLAADDRVKLAGPGGRGQVNAQLVEQRGAVGTVRAVLGVWAPWLEHAHHFGAGLLQSNAEALQHAGGDALALVQQAEEEVLGADVVVAQMAGFVNGQLDDALGPGGETDLAGGWAFRPAR